MPQGERVSLVLVGRRESGTPYEWGYTFQNLTQTPLCMQNAKLVTTTLLSWHLVTHKILKAQEGTGTVATTQVNNTTLANETKCLHALTAGKCFKICLPIRNYELLIYSEGDEAEKQRQKWTYRRAEKQRVQKLLTRVENLSVSSLPRFINPPPTHIYFKQNSLLLA